MSDAVEVLAIYLHLARASELRRRPHVRDRLLILAAVEAAKAGLPRIAAYCRHRVLEHNPQHLIRRWPTIPEALRDTEFHHFLTHLEKRYSQESAEQMMLSLGLEIGRARDTYYSDEEYAASLLAIPLSKLQELFPTPEAPSGE